MENFLLVREVGTTQEFELREGGIKIGFFQLRQIPSKNELFPEGFENHIYYEMEHEFRNMGYGIKILSYGLEKAKEVGLKEVILTCFEDNDASRRVIEKNNGKLVDKQPDGNGLIVLKYKIDLS